MIIYPRKPLTSTLPRGAKVRQNAISDSPVPRRCVEPVITPPLPPTDGELVAALSAGDHAALDELDRRYRPALTRAAVSRLGSSRGEDAVQETWLCVLKSLHTYDSQFSFRTWLWTILLNQCRRQLQRQQRRPLLWFWGHSFPSAPPSEVAEPRCASAAPPDQLLTRERAEELLQLLDRLPDHQADALRLRFFGELKFQEIADAMNCSVSAAKHRVQQGLLQLSAWLDPVPPPSSPQPAAGPRKHA